MKCLSKWEVRKSKLRPQYYISKTTGNQVFTFQTELNVTQTKNWICNIGYIFKQLGTLFLHQQKPETSNQKHKKHEKRRRPYRP